MTTTESELLRKALLGRGDAVTRIALVSDPKSGARDALSLLITSVIVDLVFSWLLMLGAGAAHVDFPAVPTPGYWNCFLVFLGLNAIGVALRGVKKVIGT